MQRNLLIISYPQEGPYIRAALPVLGKYFQHIRIHSQVPKMKTELSMLAKQYKATHIISSVFSTLQLLDPTVEGSANDNYGTKKTFATVGGDELKFLLCRPFKQLYSTDSGFFLLERFAKKLATTFTKKDLFRWNFIDNSSQLDSLLLKVRNSFLCAVDIETSKEGLLITSVAYTFGFINKQGHIHTENYVIPLADSRVEDASHVEFCFHCIRQLNNTAVPKVMQNGRYDSSYFIRFNVPLKNYIFDTYALQHCLYPELPRDLAAISSFYLEDFRFWKDEAGSNLYEYNAKDTHNTFWTFLCQLNHASEPKNIYAFTNYRSSFPLVFPCISCGLDGLEVDTEIKDTLKEKELERKEKALKEINILLGEENFNPSSPKQVAEMMKAVGYNKAKGTDEKTLVKFGEQNLLYQRLVDCILDYRGAVKAIGTYFDVTLLNNRLLYSLDPNGTESGRMASKESNFWCGTQIQNIPGYARKMVIAPEGWIYFAVDKAQSESYCTAHLTGDKGLYDAVYNSPDFHSHNASMFFGIPFEQLYDAATGTKLNVPLRNLAKRVNHGANYNMGAFVLLNTMGTKNVLEAQRLLNLPQQWKPITVCEYLLNQFDKVYPKVRGDYQKEIIKEVKMTGKLTLETGWVRRTFLKPWKTKPALNACVAHKPQSLSVALVNKAFMKVWRELQIKKYRGKFRMKAQIHDEIMNMCTPDIAEQAAKEVAEIMTIPTKINGKVMVIPSTFEINKCWAGLK